MNDHPRAELTIGALAERTGCSVPTIRYYEQIGLMPAARRRSSGHRFYDAAAEERLTFIRRCREFGFPVEQVRELVALSHSASRDCAETLQIAQAQLRTVRARLLELHGLEASLAQLAAACAAQCAGGPAANCCIPRDIARPAPAGGCCG